MFFLSFLTGGLSLLIVWMNPFVAFGISGGCILFYYIPKKIPIHFALEYPCNIICILHGVKCILHGIKDSRSLDLLCFERRKVWQPYCRRQQLKNE